MPIPLPSKRRSSSPDDDQAAENKAGCQLAAGSEDLPKDGVSSLSFGLISDHNRGPVAQRIEHSPSKRVADGSNPSGTTKPPYICPVCQRAVTSRLFELHGTAAHADCLDLWLSGQIRNISIPIGTDQTPEQTEQIRRLVDVFQRTQIQEALSLRARVARRMEVARA